MFNNDHETLVNLRMGQDSIEQFDIMRQNIGKEVTYTTLDAFGTIANGHGKLENVFDFLSIQIDGTYHSLFPMRSQPILLEVSRESDNAPLFSLNFTGEEICEFKTKLENDNSKGNEYYCKFDDLAFFLYFNTFGKIIPGLATGKLDILQQSFEYVSKTHSTLISFGIDPNNICRSLTTVLKRPITYKPTEEELSLQLDKLELARDHIEKGSQEQTFTFGFKYPIEPTKEGLMEYARTAITQQKAFGSINTLTRLIRKEKQKTI